jgi:hypothetical protein
MSDLIIFFLGMIVGSGFGVFALAIFIGSKP